MLFLGGIGIKIKTRTKAAETRGNVNSYERRNSELTSLTFKQVEKRRKYALRKLTKDKFLIQYDLSNDFYEDTIYL